MHFFFKKYKLLAFIFILLSFNTISQENEKDSFNCFTILIGKEATQDGSVMLAHNEDDWGKRLVNWYKVPRQIQTFKHDSIVLKRGYKIAQVPKTNAYLWLEIPELEFSDSYMNEYGVVVASNACKSREDKPEIENGGIGYWLRRLITERAKTAREGVMLAGEIIEQIGYASSGRTYSIADTKEVWMLSVVKGKHWVAQRVPDNHMAIIPNYYTITNIDLSDTANFLGSKDLIDYAVKRGWFDPDKDDEFNFRKAYSDQENLQNVGNKARQWISTNAFSHKQYDINDAFPFSFPPKKAVELKEIYKVLRNHYEGTNIESRSLENKFNPHQQESKSVCSNTNQYGFVAQLRNWLPIDVGSVLWIAPRRPCTQAFIPVYAGMAAVPEKLNKVDYTQALEDHFNPIENFDRYSKDHNYTVFGIQAEKIDSNYDELIVEPRRKNEKFERKLLEKQDKYEKKLMKIYNKSPRKARSKLARCAKKNFKKIRKYSK